MMHPKSLTRRDWLTANASLFASLSLPLHGAWGERPAIRHPSRSIILIWLEGGPPAIDMWDMKSNAPREVRGEFSSISTAVPGIRVCEHLPQLAKIMDRCLLVRSLHHTVPDHGLGTDYMLSGRAPSATERYPSLGAMVSKAVPHRRDVFPFVSLGGRHAGPVGFLGADHGPFAVTSVARRHGLQYSPKTARRDRLRRELVRHSGVWRRDPLVKALTNFQNSAGRILASGKVAQALAVEKEKDAVFKRYGRHPLGALALAARRLVAAGVPFVSIGFPGWDTHRLNFSQLRRRLLPPLDQALAALISDLQERGLLASTIVYCTGEFSRTPRINTMAGRDHWARSMTALLAGGSFQAGHAYGSTDEQGMEPSRHPCTPDDMTHTLLTALGVDPRQPVTTAGGRKVQLLATGKRIKGILR